MVTSFSGEGSQRTTDQGQTTGRLYHLRLRVGCNLFCNLQSRARTHAVLVIGLYELLNPTTLLIEPPGPFRMNTYTLHIHVLVLKYTRNISTYMYNSSSFFNYSFCQAFSYGFTTDTCVMSLRPFAIQQCRCTTG